MQGSQNLFSGSLRTRAFRTDAVNEPLALPERSRSATAVQKYRSAPVALRWRESGQQDQNYAPAGTNDQHVSGSGDRSRDSVTVDRSDHAEEKIIAKAREAVRQELLAGPAAERLADDVMRQIDKRLRIERERRGL